MKSSQTTVRQRVEEIASLKLLGALWTDIRQHAEKQEWGVCERQLHRYLAQAEDVIAANVEKNKDKLLAHHFAARRALYARAMAVSDYGTARAVLKDEAELLGLYPGKKMELTGKDGGPLETVALELNDDERTAAITAILARARVGKAGPRQDHSGQAESPGPPLGETGNADEPGRDESGPLASGVAPLYL